MSAEDERGIRALLDRLYGAWADGDGDAYAACFCEASDYITYNGMRLVGRAENAALHRALFRGVLKGSRISAEILSMERLAPDVALVHTAGSGRKASLQTYVLVRREGGWLIRAFQNTRIQPLGIWMTRRFAG